MRSSRFQRTVTNVCRRRGQGCGKISRPPGKIPTNHGHHLEHCEFPSDCVVRRLRSAEAASTCSRRAPVPPVLIPSDGPRVRLTDAVPETRRHTLSSIGVQWNTDATEVTSTELSRAQFLRLTASALPALLWLDSCQRNRSTGSSRNASPTSSDVSPAGIKSDRLTSTVVGRLAGGRRTRSGCRSDASQLHGVTRGSANVRGSEWWRVARRRAVLRRRLHRCRRRCGERARCAGLGAPIVLTPTRQRSVQRAIDRGVAACGRNASGVAITDGGEPGLCPSNARAFKQPHATYRAAGVVDCARVARGLVKSGAEVRVVAHATRCQCHRQQHRGDDPRRQRPEAGARRGDDAAEAAGGNACLNAVVVPCWLGSCAPPRVKLRAHHPLHCLDWS